MYIGCRAGAPVSSNVLAKRLYSAANVTETTPGVWLTASEMAFCRAEGALRGWNMDGGTAKDFYEQGVRLSLNSGMWKVLLNIWLIVCLLRLIMWIISVVLEAISVRCLR